MTEVILPEFEWVRKPGKKLVLLAQYRQQEDFLHYGLRPDLFDSIGLWCSDTGCGRRTAYNEFTFREEKQITLFLLRWSGRV